MSGSVHYFMCECFAVTGLNLGRLQYRDPVYDPNATWAKLTGLMPDTFYRVYLYASTETAMGEASFLDQRTAPAGRKYLKIPLLRKNRMSIKSP